MSCSVAGQNCPLPAALQPVSREQDIFTDQQESDLGDILSDYLVADEAVVEDDALSAHLRSLGTDLAHYLPENHFRLQFFLIDMPEANAFSLSGGRIYVSRKLVASLKSDDELAAILAHELGHVITHQLAIAMTQEFRQVLGVNPVSDRTEIANDIHKIHETWALHKLHIRDPEQENELTADQISLYVMARAGFKLQAFADALDRTADLHGKTGNWVTDLFHTTKPEQRRLREAILKAGSMPGTCIASGPATAQSGFTDWQSQVVAYKQPMRRERLRGVLLRQKLAEPLRPNVSNLRFSRDGKYVLAQDEGGIHILQRDPFKSLFFIEASGAYKASFTPDSNFIVFYTPELRIETWDIATEQRVLVREMVMNTSCLQTKLAPDGKTLACYDTKGTLWLFDTATSSPLLQRNDFFYPTELGLWMVRLGASEASHADTENTVSFVDLGFSPDGKYFLAGGDVLAGPADKSLVYDLSAKHEISVGGGVRDAINGPFAFIGNDRIFALNGRFPLKSPLVQFPSGKKIRDLPMEVGVQLIGATAGNYLIAGPVKDAALSVFDLNSKASLARIKFDAADVYNGLVLLEQADGTIALIDLASTKTEAVIGLPDSRLSTRSTVAVSPDLRWLAASTKTRGALWDLTSNTRTHSVRAFTSGWFADENALYADFPKFGNQERAIVKLDPHANANQAFVVSEIGKLPAQQFGRYLLVTTPDPKKNGDKNWTFELRDYLAKKTVWSRHFTNEFPSGTWDTDSGLALFWWGTWEGAAKNELKQFPELKAGATDEDYLFELLNLQQDAVTNKIVVNTNKRSFAIRNASFQGDWLAVTTMDERVITYSLMSGKEISHVFGYSPRIGTKSNLLIVALSETILDLYDLSTGEFRDRLKFASPVVDWVLSQDEKRLLVLTSDQTAYVLDLAAAISPEQMTTANGS